MGRHASSDAVLLASESGKESMKDPTAVAELLRQIPLFARLEPEALGALAEHTTEKSFERGDVIAQKGSPNDGLLLLVEGEMEVRRGERLFKVLGPGDYVGDMSLLDGAPHMVDVVATASGSGLFLAGYQFQVVMKNYPEVALEIIKVLVARIRETVGWLEEAEASDQGHA